jgi:diguanylate cyclase (GGDEF)-like protein/PAS domain S-box-containing protein
MEPSAHAPTLEIPYRAVAEIVPDAVLVTDERGVVAYANRAAERLLGHDLGGLVGIALDELLEASAADPRNVTARRRDGSSLVVEATATAIGNGSGGCRVLVLRDRSQQRAAEEAIERSELLLAQAARAGGIAYWEWSRGDGAVTWSEEMYRLYGVEPGSRVTVRTFLGRVHRDDLDHVLGVLKTAVDEGRPFDFEHRVVLDDGEIRVVTCHGECVAGPDGRIRRMLGIAQDITGRRRHERALRRAEKLLRVAFENAVIGMTVARPDGTWERVNEAFASMLGYTIDELTQRTYAELTHPDDMTLSHEVHRRMIDGELDRHRFCKRYLHKDGHAVWVSLSVALVRDRAGEPAFFVCQMEDITERRRMDQALRAAEERFRKVFEQSPVGIVLVDEQGRLADANGTFCEMTGYAERELLGRRLSELTHPDDVLGDDGHGGELFGDPSRPIERRFVRKDGDLIWATLRGTLARSDDGSAGYGIVTVEDVTERRRFEERLRHLADHDPLTGLLNRRRLEQELQLRIDLAARGAPGGAVLLMDLDNFKYVNDTLGHRAGDELIRGVAGVMRRRLREGDKLARLGGDEFAIVLGDVGHAEARRVAEDLRAAVRGFTMDVGGRTVRTTASIGIALIDGRVTSAERLIVEGDLAMYAAKRAGRDRVTFYEPGSDHHRLISSGFTWSERLWDALEHDRFVLHAQPIVEVATGETTRYELLLRMRDDDGLLVPPGRFLGFAERFGLMEEIDRWVACRAIDLLAERPGLTLEVNLSGTSMGSPELLAAIEERLERTGADAGRLIFEVTETEAITNMEQAREFAGSLERLGCRFALDDFGAGFGSFAYLKHLPVHYVKLDGDFIRNLPDSPADQVMVRAMVDVARGLGRRTIAEFVDSGECLELLRELGVDYAQGFYLGRPGPLP